MWTRGERDALVTVIPGPKAWRLAVLLIATIAELSLVVLLVAAPQVGLFGASIILTAYTVQLSQLADGEPCRCFGTSFEFGSRRALRVGRNIILLALAMSSAVISLESGARPTAMGLLGAVVALFLAYSLDLFMRTRDPVSFYLGGR